MEVLFVFCGGCINVLMLAVENFICMAFLHNVLIKALFL